MTHDQDVQALSSIVAQYENDLHSPQMPLPGYAFTDIERILWRYIALLKGDVHVGGSATLTLKGDGTVQAVQLYAPFGSVRYTDGTMPTPRNYTGQLLDDASGLLYDNARYYDPQVGNFTSADAVQQNAQGMNPYVYVAGNPETLSAPSGAMPVHWMAAIVAGPLVEVVVIEVVVIVEEEEMVEEEMVDQAVATRRR
jgi:RHS repeat-associated protein